MAVLTPAEFRDHYPALIGSSEDALLETLIGRADEWMARYLGFPATSTGTYTLEDATYILYPRRPDRDEPRKIVLPVRPIVSITSAYVDLEEAYGSDTEVASGDMVLDATAGAIWLTRSSPSAWAHGTRANKITVVAGYATTPGGLVVATALFVRHLLDLYRTSGVAASTLAGQSETRSDPGRLMPGPVRELLEPYRVWSYHA
jgi:hypothetical protein